MRDLIFVSLENWDDVWRRNQFLCAGLCARFPDLKIIFVEPPRDYSNHLRRGRLPPLGQSATRVLPDFPNISLVRPLKLWPNSIPAGRRANQILARRIVKSVARKMKIKAPLLWINAHECGHMAGKLGERAVIYDITDDWTQFGSDCERKTAAAQDDYLCRRADLTIVCSPWLFESRKNSCREILLLPNGVHVEHYQKLEKFSAPGLEYSRSAPQFPSPVFGYTGTLHPERVDTALLESLAEKFPGGSVVLVGPDHFDGATRARLKTHANIHLIGAVAYAEIPRHMAAFDVCIVPHLETPFTQSLNPLKLWEYLACGKPIASTNVAGFGEYSRLCHIGSGRENFIAACRAALAEIGNSERAKMRQSIAAQHSWDSRLDTLLTALEKFNS